MNFDNFFRNISIPVLVCEADNSKRVVYQNQAAAALLNLGGGAVGQVGLYELLKVERPEQVTLDVLLREQQDILGRRVTVKLPNGKFTTVEIAANRLGAAAEYIQITIQQVKREDSEEDYSEALETAFHLVYCSETIENAINDVLKLAGERLNTSRSYIVEMLSEETDANTHEWHEQGVRPAVEHLTNLIGEKRFRQRYLAQGMAVIDDIGRLPHECRAILERQEVKAVVMLPIHTLHGTLGYIGFDDCRNYRRWTVKELQFLRNLTDILASLLVARNTERGLRYSLDILQAVTNSLDSIIFVADIRSRKMLFMNQAFTTFTGMAEQDLKGQTVEQIMCDTGIDEDYPNPLDEMIAPDGTIRERKKTWEHYNRRGKRWYLVRDSIIKWIDGREVQIETATEITSQKNYEAELRQVALTDSMTGTFNREWSHQLLNHILNNRRARQKNALVFIDLDRLKQTNDRFGHVAGDQMIMKIVEVIQSCTRRSDYLCRWGGDEFLLIIRANEEQAKVVVDKIIASMRDCNEQEKLPFHLSFSYGIVEISPQRYESVEELIKEADSRMYKNKERLSE